MLPKDINCFHFSWYITTLRLFYAPFCCIVIVRSKKHLAAKEILWLMILQLHVADLCWV